MGGKDRALRATLGAILTLASLAAYAQPAGASTTLISSWIKYKYPAQAKATQTNSIASTKRWALIIGINNYASPTVDNVGSRQDAESLDFYLLKKRGWRADHVILMRDSDATAQHIIDGIRWLRAKTNGYSFVIFHYAGHENHTRTLADGDNESMDVEIWAANNRYILDGTLGREMGYVRAYQMWIDITTCRAAGFTDPGMIKAGRILTFSSYQSQFSFENPSWHHTVFGWYLINDGLIDKFADLNHDGKVSVQEAFYWSKPYVINFSKKQQTPYIVNKLTTNFYL